jgi:hypothetical protein
LSSVASEETPGDLAAALVIAFRQRLLRPRAEVTFVANEKRTLRQSATLLISLMACGLGAAAFLTFQFYRERRTAIREEQGRALMTIAEVKSKEIASWYQERLADAEVMSTNVELGRFVRDVINNRSASARAGLPSWVEQMRSHHDYAAVRVFDSSGKLRLSSEPTSPVVAPEATSFASQAIRQRQVVFEDFHA